MRREERGNDLGSDLGEGCRYVHDTTYSRSASAASSLATRSSSWATRSAMLPATDGGHDGGGSGDRLGLLGDQLLPSLLLLADLAVQQSHQRSCRRGRARHALDLGCRLECVQSLGPRPQFCRRLRTANEQHGDDGGRRIVELELLVGHLAIAGDAAPVRRVDDAHQPLRSSST